MLDLKIKEAEKTLKLGAEMSKYYYHKPLLLCYSGGKDSDVMLDIAKRCLKPDDFEVLNSHTTVDAPETVYHIRKVFKTCEEQGIKTEIRMPTYKGEPISMWRLIERQGTPPRPGVFAIVAKFSKRLQHPIVWSQSVSGNRRAKSEKVERHSVSEDAVLTLSSSEQQDTPTLCLS